MFKKLVFIFLFLLSINVFSNTKREVVFKHWKISWNESSCVIINEKKGEKKLLYQNKNTKHLKEKLGYWERVDYRMLSIVGPFISYELNYYHEGGAHPSYGKLYKTYNLLTGREARLTDIYSASYILRQLKRDRVIKRALRGRRPRSLEYLFDMVDGGCDMYISDDLLSAFAIHHIIRGKVAIRIGLPHGCEAKRGNFTQLGIYFPIPRKYRKVFYQAKKKKLLMKNFIR